MIKVMLVDDEELELIGIRELIPWSELDMEVQIALDNGFAAMDYLRLKEVDLIVTDIRMPIMSGLELAEKARELHPRVKIVLVSGYEDFNYARKAISVKASSYILKPVNDSELIEVLREVGQQLKLERNQSLREDSVMQSLDYLKNELLARCLEKTSDRKAALSLMEKFGLGGPDVKMRIAVVEIDDVSGLFSSVPEDKHAIVQRTFEEILRLCDEQHFKNICRLSFYRIAIILDEQHPMDQLQKLLNGVRECSDLTITIGVGDAVNGLGEIHHSYEEANIALSLKMLQGKDRLIFYSAIQIETEYSDQQLDHLLSRLFAAMSAYELVAIVDYTNELIVHIKKIESKSMVYYCFLYVTSRLEGYLGPFQETLFVKTEPQQKSMEMLFKLETVDDIHLWFRRTIFQVSENLHNKRLRKNQSLVGQIQEYIEQRLGQVITLKDIATAFSFSPNYLGYLFKEEMNESFSEYVLRRRMEKAKGLLKDVGLKIYEVAHITGYVKLSHFSKQFKDHTGVSPKEYRRQCQ